MPAMAQESHSPVQSLLGHRKCQTILLVNRMGRGGGGGGGSGVNGLSQMSVLT